MALDETDTIRAPDAASKAARIAIEAYESALAKQPRQPLWIWSAGQRSINVSLVEYLAAINQIAFDRRNADFSPLCVEAFS